MRSFIAFFGLVYALSAPAALQELQTVNDFENLVDNSRVPVIVQFSAYWCGPCKQLTAVMQRVASSYSASQVQIAKVDAHVNSSLRTYLKGGYPTVRVFFKGSVSDTKYFAGSQTESFVRNYINDAISNPLEEVLWEADRGAYCVE